MTFFIKYLSAFILTFSLIGCQGDSAGDGGPPDQQLQESLQDQVPSSATDVDLSDSELETFTDAIASARQVQIEAQQGMVGVVEDEGLEVQTYNKIAQAVQRGQSPDEAGISSEDMEKFKSISQDIKKVQSKTQQDVSRAVENAGMEMDRFQEINQAVQQDSELKKRVIEKIQETKTGEQRPTTDDR